MEDSGKTRLQRLRERWGRRPSSEHEPIDAHGYVEVEEAVRICPSCKKMVSRGATVCLYCERDLAPLMAPVEFGRRFGGPPMINHHKRETIDPGE